MRSREPTPGTIHPICTTRCGVSSCLPLRACEPASNVEDFALTPAERALFRALQARGVRFMLVGLGAAVLEGAPLATQDLDVWLERLDERVQDAARDAGGFWVSGFGAQPPAFGGDGLDRVDVVLTVHGVEGFDIEYAGAATREVDGIPLKVLPLTRIIASKRATNRPKDQAALPALEATLLARDAGGGEPPDA